MVITKARRTGNWRRKRLTGRSSEGSIVILGMKTTFPAYSPPNMRHLKTIGLTSNKIMRVPLQRPLVGSMLRSNIRGHPGLRARRARGRPEALIELRNSVGYKVALSPTDGICAHLDGLLSRKGVKDDMIKMIDLIVCGRKDGVFWVGL